MPWFRNQPEDDAPTDAAATADGTPQPWWATTADDAAAPPAAPDFDAIIDGRSTEPAAPIAPVMPPPVVPAPVAPAPAAPERRTVLGALPRTIGMVTPPDGARFEAPTAQAAPTEGPALADGDPFDATRVVPAFAPVSAPTTIAPSTIIPTAIAPTAQVPPSEPVTPAEAAPVREGEDLADLVEPVVPRAFAKHAGTPVVTIPEPDGAPTDGAPADDAAPTATQLPASDLPGPDHPGPDLAGPDHSGPDRSGPDRSGPDLAGPDLPGPDHLEPEVAPEPDNASPLDRDLPFEPAEADDDAAPQATPYEDVPVPVAEIGLSFGERIERLIAAAVAEADNTRADALHEAEQLQQSAQLDAEHAVAAAQRQAAEIMASAQRRCDADLAAAQRSREEAEKALAEARAEADELRRHARDEVAELRTEVDLHAQAMLARTHADTTRTLAAARAELEEIAMRKAELEGQMSAIRALLSDTVVEPLPPLPGGTELDGTELDGTERNDASEPEATEAAKAVEAVEAVEAAEDEARPAGA